MFELSQIFFNVIAPVFGLVIVGYFAAPRLNLEARTLSRYAYYIAVPAFVFNVMSQGDAINRETLDMVAFIALVEIAIVIVAFLIARLLGKSAAMTAAFVLIAVFGNVGNFGFPIIEFRLGPNALIPATTYFLVITTISFVIGIAAANFSKGRGLSAIINVAKTPALLALIPALLVNAFDWPVPVLISRMSSLLGSAMVPTMLVTLGVQLAQMKQLRITLDTFTASALRLVVSPLLAIALASFFSISPLARAAGIFQAGMPAAVLTSIIAIEYDVAPDFVTTTVLFSTVASVLTLTLLLAVV